MYNMQMPMAPASQTVPSEFVFSGTLINTPAGHSPVIRQLLLQPSTQVALANYNAKAAPVAELLLHDVLYVAAPLCEHIRLDPHNL
jgi:hypothetical protein